MQVKKPSLKGEKCTEYLGHFAKDKWLEKGHNDVPDSGCGALPFGSPEKAKCLSDAEKKRRKRSDASEGDETLGEAVGFPGSQKK